MKWKMVLGALVVSAGLCNQGYGFELLDRMLGINGYGGHGCNSCCEPACCEAEPACCEAEPACCEAEPACCEAEPACCEADPCDTCAPRCRKKHCGGLLSGLFACKKHCHRSCNSCDTCGNGGCDSCGNGCSSCNGGGHASPAAADEAAPVPPAPMADPSASIQSSRQIVKANARGTVVRRR